MSTVERRTMLSYDDVQDLVDTVEDFPTRLNLRGKLDDLSEELIISSYPPSSIQVVHVVLDALGLRYTELDPLARRTIIDSLSDMGDEVVVQENDTKIDLIEREQNNRICPPEF